MGRNSGTNPHIRFALLSAIAVGVIAAAFAFVGLRMRVESQEATVAAGVASVAATPILAILEDTEPGEPLSIETRERIDAAVWQLTMGSVRGVRIWSADPGVLYEAGAVFAGTSTTASDGITHSRASAADNLALFVTRASRDGISVEVAQDAGPIDASIGSGNAEFVLTVAGFAFAAFVLLQGAFAWGIHKYSRAHGTLEYLYDTGQELRSSLDLDEVLSRVAGDATKLVGAQYGFIGIFDAETSDIVLRSSYHGLSGNVALHRKPLDDWFVRRAVATNSTIVTNQSANAFRSIFGQEIDTGAGWVICAPMSIRDRVVGCVAVLRSHGRTGFIGGEPRLIEHLAAQAVTAVEQAVLFAKVRRDAEQLESSYDSTLKALMAALDAKDEVTEGHCERVAKLTTELARMMNVPESKMVHIERGALLHDVGKIGVPDGILKKPAALNDTEWEAMRKHPLLAGLMVSKVGFLEPALPILLYHHEKYDGTGYPFGLAMENIPLEARIFSIIDAYDAMTSDRPYRPAMTHHAAMEEVRSNTGTQFDPQVVAAFEELMGSRRDLREPAGRRVLGMHDLEHLSQPDEHVA